MHNKIQPIHIVQVLVFAVAAFLVAIVIVRGIGKLALLDDGYEIQARFTDVATLPVEAPVKIAEVQVGRVKKLTVDPQTGEAVATLFIKGDKDVPPIYGDASAQIRTLSILGLRYVSLDPGRPQGAPVGRGFTISSANTRGQGSLEQLNAAAGPQLRDKATVLLENLTTGLSGIEQTIKTGFKVTNRWSGPLAVALRDRDAQTNRLLRNSSRFFTTLGDKSQDIGGIIDSGDRLTRELNSQRAELSRFLDTYPGFGRTLRDNAQPLLDLARQGTVTLRKLNDLDPEIRKTLDAANPLFDQFTATDAKLRSLLAVAAPTLEVVAQNRIGIERFNRTFPTFAKGSITASTNYPRQTSVQIVNGEDAIANALIALQQQGQVVPTLPGAPGGPGLPGVPGLPGLPGASSSAKSDPATGKALTQAVRDQLPPEARARFDAALRTARAQAAQQQKASR